MAGFIQVIEYTSSRMDEIRQLGEDFRQQAAARGSGPVRVTVTEVRDRPNTYMTIAEFASYDEAMANSNDAATQQFAEAMGKLCDGPPSFYNLDVADSWSR